MQDQTKHGKTTCFATDCCRDSDGVSREEGLAGSNGSTK